MELKKEQFEGEVLKKMKLNIFLGLWAENNIHLYNALQIWFWTIEALLSDNNFNTNVMVQNMFQLISAWLT